MEATIVSDNVKHYPVLLKEIISVITPPTQVSHLLIVHLDKVVIQKKF